MTLGKYSGFWGEVHDVIWIFWTITKLLACMAVIVIWAIGFAALTYSVFSG